MLNYKATFSSFSTNDLEKAKQFYGETLGLEIKEITEGLELHLKNGARVFIYQKGEGHQPATFTVLNFLVDDIEAEVDSLTTTGVKFEVYDTPQMKTNEKGISQNEGEPGTGPIIAWFKDPAGNFLSIIQEQE